MPKLGFSDALAFVGLALTLVLVVLDKAGKLKGPILLLLLGLGAVLVLPIALGNSWVEDASTFQLKLTRGFSMVCLVGLCYGLLASWISQGDAPQETEEGQAPITDTSIRKTPSFLFITGAPLGDNESATWVMMARHYGPNRAYDCTIEFTDLDRKNVEHEWLVKHPDTPFLPQGMFDKSQFNLRIAEAGPEPATAESFQWKPLDPNHQHYVVNVSCRDGYFVENWEVVRVNGVLRGKIVIQHGPQWIQNNPDQSPIIFQYQDPDFISAPLLTEIPKIHGKDVHFGWKPKYKFAVPCAIYDPNGHIQVVSGVKQQDGSTHTDFGSWNLLTKHFGDTK